MVIILPADGPSVNNVSPSAGTLLTKQFDIKFNVLSISDYNEYFFADQPFANKISFKMANENLKSCTILCDQCPQRNKFQMN